MWRDEIHSWGLVLDSPTLSDLFANLRFTGHPGLWYFLLWLASWFTDSPYAVQVVHAAIAHRADRLIGLGSPFSRLEGCFSWRAISSSSNTRSSVAATGSAS